MTKPGGLPPGAPTDFEYEYDQRLVTNGNITRMPTSQREWNGFIQELNKWTKNQTDGFTPVFTGFAVDPGVGYGGDGPLVLWQRYGQMVMLEFLFCTGTSDETYFTITNLPAIITPKRSSMCVLTGMSDNSTSLTDPQAVKVGTDGVLAFYATAFEGQWTNSNGKGWTTGIEPKSIIYSLRHPSKL